MSSPSRVSHVVYCFEPHELDGAADFWRRTAGVVFDEVPLPTSGLRILWSFDAGLELLSPVDDRARPKYREFLDAHGSGLYALVYRVPDLDAAAEAAQAAGAATEVRLSYADREPWSLEYDLLDEAILEDHLGMRVVLAAIERKPTP